MGIALLAISAPLPNRIVYGNRLKTAARRFFSICYVSESSLTICAKIIADNFSRGQALLQSFTPSKENQSHSYSGIYAYMLI